MDGDLKQNIRSYFVKGSKSVLIGGIAVTTQSGADCPPYWFSGDSTIILGAATASSDAAPSDTLAAWNIHTDAPSIHYFNRGHLVVACLRYFGGLHSPHKGARADVFQRSRCRWIRVADYSAQSLRLFSSNPCTSLPDFWPVSACQTICAWPLHKKLLVLGDLQQVKIRIDKAVRWDIDYVCLFVESQKIRPRIFLSYSTKDKPIAKKLVTALSERNIGVWLDQAELIVGDRLAEKINLAISTVSYVVILFSNNSLKSEWMRRELEVAMNYEREKNCIKVFPLSLIAPTTCSARPCPGPPTVIPGRGCNCDSDRSSTSAAPRPVRPQVYTSRLTLARLAAPWLRYRPGNSPNSYSKRNNFCTKKEDRSPKKSKASSAVSQAG